MQFQTTPCVIYYKMGIHYCSNNSSYPYEYEHRNQTYYEYPCRTAFHSSSSFSISFNFSATFLPLSVRDIMLQGG